MPDTQPSEALPPGFIALHGNRTEALLDTVAAWLARHPLAPLEPEVVLVQSSGMAEWVKMTLARSAGVCAAAAVQLPGRFLWQTYRQVLGRAQVPARSPLDKTALAWRLMRCLPALLDRAGFEPLAGYLDRNDPDRLFHLALRVADLYDQYQVHRPDWLEAWSEAREVLIDTSGRETPLPAEARWQARLWQAVLAELDPQQRTLTRPQLHERALEALAATAPGTLALPRRVVLFGMTHVPLPILRLLAALSQHAQIILAVPNPCRFHWADIMDGREWLRCARRRLPLRAGRSGGPVALDAVPLELMHLHAHPLLAAWGRQARDFVRQLDHFDDVAETRRRFPLARLDLFDEDSPADATLLRQVQDHIRDLLPLEEHPRPQVPASDHSIVFHIAHSPVRELEILHDQLLQRLASSPGGKPLRPRDIVVMVPAIDDFAPAIRAVFGQYGRHDPRHIPFDIADLSARASSPLMTAVEWLLRLPSDRCRLSELAALLDVPAIAARFGIDAEGKPRLAEWMRGAGIRWGLDAAHRAGLALSACGPQNTALFGVDRMLMGYAVGRAPSGQETPYAGIEPYDEVGGLDAALAGGFARLVERLVRWQADSTSPASPADWAGRLRALVADLTQPVDEADRKTLAALDDALKNWLDACAEAGFDAVLPLSVVADAWLAELEAPALGKRFRAGGVTFCTLMPMRAIPFELVCLLGMNDGDYPRRSPRNDFDLMALPGQQRPGDRARRDDDRQLMLEALLSARRGLYLSWSGRNVRDNSEQPPSVLVAQLRDYLAAGWSPEVVSARTTEHPLQPFSRRYFEPDAPIFTYAREWRAAHLTAQPAAGSAPVAAFTPDPAVPLSAVALARFLRNPVKVFFAQRLGVRFDERPDALPDDESFGLDGLEQYGLIGELANAVLADMAAVPTATLASFALDDTVRRQLFQVERAGRLPMAGLGVHTRTQLQNVLQTMMQAWRSTRLTHPHGQQRLPLRFTHAGVVMEDWLDQRFAHSADGTGSIWLALDAGKLIDNPKKMTLRPHKLIAAWVTSLLAAASDAPGDGVLIGRDAVLHITAHDPHQARERLSCLIEAWISGLGEPLPVAAKTALAFVQDGNPALAYEGNERSIGEVDDPCLARCYPDFDALNRDGRFEQLARTLYAPLQAWATEHVAVTLHAAAADPAPGMEAA